MEKKFNLENNAISITDQNWATFSHLSSFAIWIGIPFGNIIVPLIIWQLKKNELPFTEMQVKEVLNFQISWTIYSFISAILCFILVGFIGLIILGIMDLVLPILGAIKAKDSIPYRYPLTIRFLK